MDGDAPLRLASSGGTAMVPSVVAAAREAGILLGLDAHGADELREGCRLLLARTAAGGGPFEVSIRKGAARVVVEVSDQGEPYELAGRSELLDVLRGHVDAVHFHYEGRAGNRIELVKRVRRRHDPGLEVVPQADPEAEVEIREMRPSDAVAFVRNVYRSYGYSYEGDWAYRAEDVVDLLRSGVLRAWVAVTEDGTVVGQAALRRDPPSARIAEGGAAMIDPPFRHRGLTMQLGLAALPWIGEQQLEGLMAHATTRHPYSQRGAIGLGAHETAVLLGYIPDSVAYRGIQGADGRRTAVMVMFRKLNGAPPQPLHLPERHRPMLERIIALAELEDPIADPAEAVAPSERTEVGLSVLNDHGVAIIDVRQPGADVAASVHEHLDRLLPDIAAVCVDLPLWSPATPAASEALEALGLSFAGVFPRDAASGGMRLRLQRLAPHVAVSAEDIQVASDFGGEVRDYVIAAHEASGGA
jgi:hypothetical protein